MVNIQGDYRKFLGILNAILGLRCLQNYPITAAKLGNEASIRPKSGFDYTVCSVV